MNSKTQKKILLSNQNQRMKVVSTHITFSFMSLYYHFFIIICLYYAVTEVMDYRNPLVRFNFTFWCRFHNIIRNLDNKKFWFKYKIWNLFEIKIIIINHIIDLFDINDFFFNLFQSICCIECTKMDECMGFVFENSQCDFYRSSK